MTVRLYHRARRALASRPRQLQLELLEERDFLDAGGIADPVAVPAAEATPYLNPVYRLDVNNDAVTTPADVLAIVNRILTHGLGPLPTPTEPVEFYYDTDGNNRLTSADLLRVINGILQPPDVVTVSLTTATSDVTPQVTVTAQALGSGNLPNGSTVWLDVDLNNDGDFTDPGETAQSQSTLFEGHSTFSLTTPLARTGDPYLIRMQARVKDTDGVVGTSQPLPLLIDTRTSDALANYVNTPDPAYQYSVRGSVQNTIPLLGSYTYYAIDMTSQTWRSEADVNLPVWRHWMRVFVPENVPIENTALLLIDGGSNTNFDDIPADEPLLAQAAVTLRTVIVDLAIVPNEPVIFTDETRTRSEDAIIAYTFDKFLKNVGEPGNDTWPVLVAMVKSAVRAMDTTQDFIPTVTNGTTIDDFVVTGYSKRGWTTWLTAAVDDRVRAIMPGVFDNLNQGPQMVHHYEVYGFFSQAVHDYNDMQIFDRMQTPEALLMSQIVDPYRYLNNGRFDNMPKLIINSAGDEFFVSDSAQYYFDDIPGNQNYLLYLPNTGHGLDIDAGADSQVLRSTVTFVDAVIHDRTLPSYSWTVGQDGAIRVETDTTPLEVRLWQADNPNARDFRHAYNPSIVWTSQVLSPEADGSYIGNVAMPSSGARAYFVQLTLPNSNVSINPLLSAPYVFTTEIRVKSTLPLYDWPFEVVSADNLDLLSGVTPLVAASVSSAPDSATNAAIASALAMRDDFTEVAMPLASDEHMSVPSAAPLPMAPAVVAVAGGPELFDDGIDDEELIDYLVDPVLEELLV